MFKKIFFFYILTFFTCNFIFSQETKELKVSVLQNKEIYTPNDTVLLAVKVEIKDKYHINSYQTDDPTTITSELKADTIDYLPVAIFFPPDELYKFEFSENKIRVYKGNIYIGISFISKKELKDGDYKIPLTFRYQACDDKACYEPRNVKMEVNVKVSKEKFSKTFSNESLFKNIDFSKPTIKKEISSESLKENQRTEGANPDEEKVSNFIEEKGIVLGLFFIFLGGLALNLTPCIYPLIPITISFFGAQASGNKMHSIMMGIFYALGMAVTYSALGLFAALTGSLLGNALQNPIVIVAIALILLALGTSMFGLFEIRVPQKLALAGNKSRSGLLGSLLMGLMVGFIAAPCIGPFVLSLLVYVGKMGNPFMGFLLFFVLSMGLGFPYIFLAAFSSALNKLPRSGEWMEGVKVIFGLVLFGMALNTLSPIITKDIFAIAFPLYIISCGVYLILIDKKGLSAKGFTKVKYLIAIIALIYGSWILKPQSNAEEVKWKMLNSLSSIESSISSEKKPVMIDFYADWCAQCKELDQFTYNDKSVVEESKGFNNIKIDLTKENKEISDKFNIKGLPAVIFINSKGEEIKELRVTGFLKPQEFVNKIKLLKETDKK
ncbi:MAG TPA: cytochrome c biogenesis protein CcdA [Ignavibacteria bacterium]